MKKISFISTFFAALFFATISIANQPYIVTTTSQVADIIRNVACDLVEVEALMGPGIDPHLYRLTRKDMSKLLKADMIFYNGLHLEGKVTETMETFVEYKMKVHKISDALPPAFLIPGKEGALYYDPHIWMNVQAWQHGTDLVLQEMIKFDPENKLKYEENAKRYKAKLALLDQQIHKTIQTIPADSRVLVTAHDAFNYLGKAYGLEVLGIQGLSTESEAGLRQIEALANFLVVKQIKSVFVETNISDRNIKAVIQGAKSRGHEVEIGGFLYSDAMGREDAYEGTYIGMMDHNIKTLVKSLGGQVPECGLFGCDQVTKRGILCSETHIKSH